MKNAVAALASLFLSFPACAQEGHVLAVLGAEGEKIAAQASAVSKQVSLEQRLRRATNLELSKLPAYMPELLKEAKAAAAKEDVLKLREKSVQLENYLLKQMESGGLSCQDQVPKAAQDHRGLAQATVAEMGGIHAAQLRLIEGVAAAVLATRGQAGGLMERLEADMALLSQLRVRVPRGAVGGTAMIELEAIWADALKKEFRANYDLAEAAIGQLERTHELVFDGGQRGKLLLVELREDGPKLISKSPGFRSKTLSPLSPDPDPYSRRERHGLYYLSTVSSSLRTQAVEGKELRQALKAVSSHVAFMEERQYVAEQARNCLELAGVRLVLADNQ